MNERQLEIIVRRCPEAIFGDGFKLAAQQLSLSAGRIDILLKDNKGRRHVVELKKGSATKSAIDQVLSYYKAFELESDIKVTPWILAHEISESLLETAKKLNVNCKIVSTQQCDEIREKYNITDREMIGARKDSAVISGGGAKKGLRNLIPNELVYPILPKAVSDLLIGLENHKYMELLSGSMQTVIFYKCCKLGGYNRTDRGGHFYISNGIVISTEFEKNLTRLGFFRQTKTQSGSNHEHVWWEISHASTPEKANAFNKALNLAIKVVDGALNG